MFDATFPSAQVYQSIYIEDIFLGTNDTIYGGDGDDFILGQNGADTIHGGAGQDDILGGHNVLGGHDDNDTISGGDDADVILGDNGVIHRDWTGDSNNRWELYPAPFADVKRTVERFDDIEANLVGIHVQQFTGNDTISGDEGDDIIHGQRGDDVIHGGAGDDELIGQLGSDTIHGDAGHDTILADNGYITRDYIDSQHVRTNNNESWHRDITLQSYVTISEMFQLHESLASEELDRLLAADWTVTLGRYNNDGQQVHGQHNSWDTRSILLESYPIHDDQISGGDGDDVLIGQQGDDEITGDDGNDLILGDNAQFTTGVTSDLPLISNGYQIFSNATPPYQTLLDSDAIAYSQNESGQSYLASQYEQTSNSAHWSQPERGEHTLQIGYNGAYIQPPISIRPEELNYNAPFNFSRTFGNIASKEISGSTDTGRTGVLQDRYITTGAATGLIPMAIISQQASSNSESQDGNDTLNGGGGDDLILGDFAQSYNSLVSGINDVEQANQAADTQIQLLQHTLSSLAGDHLYSTDNTDAIEVSFGNDTIRGDAGNDILVGDTWEQIFGIQQSLPTSEARIFKAAKSSLDYAYQLQTILSDLDSQLTLAHFGLLSDLSNESTRPDHALRFGNDTIHSGEDDDSIYGDNYQSVLGTVLSNRFDNAADNQDILTPEIRSALSTYRDQLQSNLDAHRQSNNDVQLNTFTDNELAALPDAVEPDMNFGNDTIDSGAGDDIVSGDFTIHVSPLVTNETIGVLAKQVLPRRPDRPAIEACLDNETAVSDKLNCFNTGSDDVQEHELILIRFIERFNQEVEAFLEQNRHEYDYSILESKYSHPYFGARHSEESLAAFHAGNDQINGGEGDDYLLGDSISYFSEQLIDSNGRQSLTFATTDDAIHRDPYAERLDQKLEFQSIHRNRFEILNRFISGSDSSTIENDHIDGGQGDDILFGQVGNDELAGNLGEDRLYGGSHENDLSTDSGDLEAQNSSDDHPEAFLLGLLKQQHELKDDAWSEAFQTDAVTIANPSTASTLMFDHLAGNYLVSDEATDWSYEAVSHNPISHTDVDSDGFTAPNDALIIINRMNGAGSDEVPFILGGLTSRILSNYHLDVSADNLLSPLDALIVINRLNSN